MESYLPPSSEGINGINLANYFPNRRSYNSVVYFHKRLLSNIKEERMKDIKKDEKVDKGKNKKKKNGNNMKHDRSQQFNGETMNQQTLKFETVNIVPYSNSVLDQTIRFAKNLVPIVIPQESPSVFYTIKSTQKHRKRGKKSCESTIEQDVTYNKDKNKKNDVTRTKKYKKENSLKESIDPSSQNTLDDVHININQSCSFSESTEVKFHKKATNQYKVTNESSQKFFISNSFEALATEYLVDGSKIKIHLMNDTDKHQLRESIQNPIINTIKEYLTHLNFEHSKDLNADLKTVQKLATSNSQKLDYILEKLSCFKKGTEKHADKTRKEAVPRVQSASIASKLEQLGQDIMEVKDHSSEDEDISEEYNNMVQRRKNRGKSVVVALEPKQRCDKEDKKKEALGCGEEVPGPLNATSSISQLGVKPDRPNRIPARFCWTDADRKK